MIDSSPTAPVCPTAPRSCRHVPAVGFLSQPRERRPAPSGLSGVGWVDRQAVAPAIGPGVEVEAPTPRVSRVATKGRPRHLVRLVHEIAPTANPVTGGCGIHIQRPTRDCLHSPRPTYHAPGAATVRRMP
jgi:hypothetical protein